VAVMKLMEAWGLRPLALVEIGRPGKPGGEVPYEASISLPIRAHGARYLSFHSFTREGSCPPGSRPLPMSHGSAMS